MARIYVSRDSEGTYTVRGTRFEGKSLAARKVYKKVDRAHVGAAAGEVMKALGNRGDRPKVMEETAGERGVA